MAMSYDLMVYEKGKAPVDQQKFMGWYNEKIESGNGKGISYASEKMQTFFHSVRNIFPPMDGPFANTQIIWQWKNLKWKNTFAVIALWRISYI